MSSPRFEGDWNVNLTVEVSYKGTECGRRR
nr:MAG TPA: hypothetical protein [Caudoviricetes sp.]